MRLFFPGEQVESDLISISPKKGFESKFKGGECLFQVPCVCTRRSDHFAVYSFNPFKRTFVIKGASHADVKNYCRNGWRGINESAYRSYNNILGGSIILIGAFILWSIFFN